MNVVEAETSEMAAEAVTSEVCKNRGAGEAEQWDKTDFLTLCVWSAITECMRVMDNRKGPWKQSQEVLITSTHMLCYSLRLLVAEFQPAA